MRAALILCALLLASCEDKEVARKRNEDRLPEGCRIVDLDYGDLRAAVVCEGRKSTTSLRSWDTTMTVPVYNAATGMMDMQVQTQHHVHLSAEIGSR